MNTRLDDKMRKRAKLLPFLLVVIVYLVAMFFEHRWILLIFKPLIVATLLFYFLNVTRKRFVKFKWWMIFALVFCIMGDTFLMFSREDEFFFILGLSAFLIGHVFYMLVFRRITSDKFISFHLPKTLFVVAYVVLLLYLLIPRANALWLPVALYVLVIGTMLVFAFHLTKMGGIGWLIATGAFLFVISDSFIALNKFYSPIPCNNWMVMITYIAAQFFIVHGVARYILQR